jgi:phosphatidylserine synthase 2
VRPLLCSGVVAAVALGLVFCAEHLRDTLFVRPHPALWRLVTGAGLFYAMALAFLLFQDLPDARAIIAHLDPRHSGRALPEKSYGEDCAFTPSNVFGAMDEFVIAHLLGWAFKAAMVRDVRISMVLSATFELMEYTFTFLQPNFNECWWDHWLLDFVLCNTGGIVIGHAVMSWLDSREYNWAGLADVPSVPGKLARLAQQFTPYSWTRYEWHMFEDVRRFAYVTFMVVSILVCELDAFFLKYILLVTPPSPLNLYRLLIWWAVGMVALRDYYAFITDPRIKRLGSTCWVILAVLLMELAVVFKFGMQIPEWRDAQPPAAVVWGWGVTLSVATVALTWWFALEQPRRRKAGAAAAAVVAAPAAATPAGGRGRSKAAKQA